MTQRLLLLTPHPTVAGKWRGWRGCGGLNLITSFAERGSWGCRRLWMMSLDAALNIQREALATASWAGSHACGEEGAGRGRKTPVKPASLKQEVTHVLKCHG